MIQGRLARKKHSGDDRIEPCAIMVAHSRSPETETLMLEFESVRMRLPEDSNISIGQTHFIKTAEDMYEAVVNTVPQAKFGLAFDEASGPCMTRAEGNDSGNTDSGLSSHRPSIVHSPFSVVC